MSNLILQNCLHLSNIPTPIQEISFNGHTFLLKRDDLTGLETSGNKVRKLDYIFKDVLDKGANHVITCGGEQSNHARATTYAAASLGLGSSLILWGEKRKMPDGNHFLNQVIGADIEYVGKKSYMKVNGLLERRSSELQSEGKVPYIIPEGGSSVVGVTGYVRFIQELMEQVDLSLFDGIAAACGSGGTAAGLLSGISLYGLSGLKIYAVNVLYGKRKIRNRILKLGSENYRMFGKKKGFLRNNLEILDGYSAEGYKKILPEKLKLIRDFASKTGILLDPVYTGKAFYAFCDLMKQNPGKNYIFIHTGGFAGIFSKRKEYMGA